MIIYDLNNFDNQEAKIAFFSCCGSDKWANKMVEQLPFASEKDLADKATKTWYNECNEPDWHEAFSHHPKIGDIKNLEEKFASSKHLAGVEQAGVNNASEEVIQALAKANMDYEQKFGFIFIVCATGKSAHEMLQLLQDRLENTYEEELHIAMGEQHKITFIRLKKLLDEADWQPVTTSQVTTHVLDTSIGKPGKDISIKLKQQKNGWQTISQGITNADGRIGDLLPPGRYLSPGNYKMVFETSAYFERNNITGFYPEVEIQFTVFDDQHYHVPLLINPFGYSTYRGS